MWCIGVSWGRDLEALMGKIKFGKWDPIFPWHKMMSS